MKRLILIAFLAVAYTTTQAQFGVKAGLNIANLGGDDADFEDKKALLGFYGGIFYNIGINEKFSIQPELVYSGQGTKFDEQGFDVKLKLSYINLTPLVRYNSSGFFVGVGPQIGFLTSAKVKVDDESEDIKDQLKGIDIAAAVAVGYEMENGFGVYVRYNHGLSNIFDEDDVEVFNRVFQVGVRYRFAMTKK